MNESPTCLSPLLHHSVPPGCPVVSIMGCPRASIKAGSKLLHCLPDLAARYSGPLPPLLLPLTTSGFTAFHKFLPEAFKDKIRQRKSPVHTPRAGLSREGQGNALLPHPSCCRPESISLCPSLHVTHSPGANKLLSPSSAPNMHLCEAELESYNPSEGRGLSCSGLKFCTSEGQGMGVVLMKPQVERKNWVHIFSQLEGKECPFQMLFSSSRELLDNEPFLNAVI